MPIRSGQIRVIPSSSARSSAHNRSRRGARLKAISELMTKQQVFSFEPPARLEKASDKHSEHVENCKHWSKSCGDSRSRGESGPDRIFGKDRGPCVLLTQSRSTCPTSSATHFLTKTCACAQVPGLLIGGVCSYVKSRVALV